ncbi:hypothetical protein ACV07N_11195 [Roseivirga echinicomitans]
MPLAFGRLEDYEKAIGLQWPVDENTNRGEVSCVTEKDAYSMT